MRFPGCVAEGGVAGLDAGGGAVAAPAVEERKFILLVASEDEELLPEQRKCPVSAGTLESLCTAIQEKLTLPVRHYRNCVACAHGIRGAERDFALFGALHSVQSW